MLESDYPNAQMDGTARARLLELELIAEQGLQTFYEVGKALKEIRHKKQSRETHKTFEAYFPDLWNIARPRAYQFINAALVVENLSTICSQIPTSECLAGPQTGLPLTAQIQIWQKAVESAPNNIPTGAAVKRKVEQQESSGTTRRTSVEVPSELEQLLLENKRLKHLFRQQNAERERRAAEVSEELERLRFENLQLRAPRPAT